MALSALKRRELVVMSLCSLLSGPRDQGEEQLFEGRSLQDEAQILMDQCRVTRRWASAAVEQARAILKAKSSYHKLLDQQELDLDWKRLGRVEESVLLWFLHALDQRKAGGGEELVLREEAQESEAVRVLISEAIRLVRKFSSRQNAGYINVLLDRYCHNQSMIDS